MARCSKCNEVYSEFYLINGVCEDCISGRNKDIEIKYQSQKEEEKIKQEKINSIIITTENAIDSVIENRITIISTQCIYGINILKDSFSFVRDIVGGRVNSLETGLNEATETVLNELKNKAYLLGGDAVIGIKIEHTYNNANGGSILSVMAVGTVVKLKDKV